MRSPSFVRRMMKSIEVIDPDGVIVELIHGPYDGAQMSIERKHFMRRIKQVGHFSIELSEDSGAVAVYSLHSPSRAVFAYYGVIRDDCGEK